MADPSEPEQLRGMKLSSFGSIEAQDSGNSSDGPTFSKAIVNFAIPDF